MSACDTKTSGAGPTIDGVLHALAQTPSARPFRGTPRYGFVRCLGEGGFGVVYECSDRELGRNVALKLLKPRPTGFAASIRRLKSEFRSVADIVHENVVGLYELACEGERWFIVMELVHGCDLLRFVRAGAPARSAGAQRDSAELLSVPRLRSCLRQIVAGVGAMHNVVPEGTPVGAHAKLRCGERNDRDGPESLRNRSVRGRGRARELQ